MKKVLFITGSYPPEICGVGDYTSKLVNSEIGVHESWIVFHKQSWSIFQFFNYVQEISRIDPSHLILQYPTQGYGWSILPHLLCFYYSLFTKVKFISVLHEFSNATLKNKIAELIFLFCSNELIVTNDFEKKNIKKICFWLKNIHTIRICSNIVACNELNTFYNRHYDLVYFGHIRPNKGLEDFLDLIRSNDYFLNKKLAIIGQVPKGFESYFNSIQEVAENFGIKLILNKPEEEISEILNDSKFAYLPFPDGVSERRGSFLACAFNGVNIITTKCKYTTEELQKCVFLPNNNSEIVKYITEMDEHSFLSVQLSLKKYINESIPATWNDVANLYKQVI